MSKCISRHGEYSEHQTTDGVCDMCGVETAPLTHADIAQIIIEHSAYKEVVGGVVCSQCEFMIALRFKFAHQTELRVASARHVAEVIMARLDTTP